MLHLLPIRLILTVFIIILGFSLFGAAEIGSLPLNDFSEAAKYIFRYSSKISLVFVIVLWLLWRWVPFIQRFIFPYLGGQWKGIVTYTVSGEKLTADVTLEIKHTLLGLKLILDSNESRSRTLVVHAQKDPDFAQYDLYYVYRNERKPGFPVTNGIKIYRGVSIMQVDTSTSTLKLTGDYFTDAQKSGTLSVTYTSPNPFWKVWR